MNKKPKRFRKTRLLAQTAGTLEPDDVLRVMLILYELISSSASDGSLGRKQRKEEPKSSLSIRGPP